MRRPALLLAGLTAASLLTGCATLDDDVVASFGDRELDQSAFDDRYAAVAGEPVDGRIGGDAARSVIMNWIIEEMLREVGIVERYEQGPEASGVLCVSIISTENGEEAAAYLQRLEGGEVWSDLAADVGPESATCTTTESLGPLAPQVAAMTLDAPYAVVLFDDQSAALLRMRSVSEIDPRDLAGVAQAVDPESTAGLGDAVERTEVYVDPKYGEFDVGQGVVPLG